MAPSATTNNTNGNGHGVKRPIRVAGCSGGVYDRKRAIHDMAKNEDVDVITGDWMSECNMTLRGSDKRDRLVQKTMSSGSTVVAKGYEPYFLYELDAAIPWLAKRGVKIAVNAGASDVHGLAEAVKGLIKKHGVELKVGVVDGDDVTDAVLDLYKKGEKFLNLPANKPIQEWGFDPICAQCYLGGTGIAECFKAGADIVLCGRVADASVTVGAAMWWHGWTRDNLSELAGALMIGHIIECSTYATGGYYSGFKDLGLNDTDMGYPIAAIDEKGEAVITMEEGKHGLVTTATIASQLLYEIQGPLYYNSDVTASIEDMHLKQISKNAVHISCVKGLPPPSTTKVGITAKGGWQAEYWVSLLPQTFVHETAHLPDGTVVDIPAPTIVREYEREQPSYDTANAADLKDFGETTRGPLGWVVLGRSGDKSSNANLGIFVRHDDEWDWLRSLLSTAKLRELLGKDDKGRQIDRCEFPNIRAVHFLLKDHLDRGFNSTSSFDSLGKNLCEYIRSRHVDIPNKFLERGRV
ncbi:hypothetical protein COL922a_011178 [Colletotrichum nupharicola]|nr:hypothetical protein COL922a_011178 [Colletotrichum nupharicola]